MEDSFLVSLIQRLNNGRTNGLIHLRPLTDLVDFSKVWAEKPKPKDDINYYGPHKLYFIKNQEGKYVAVVLDMTQNLHWLVLKQHRGNGHLTNAMKTTILPHLFQDREEQRITIDVSHTGLVNFKASEKVAINLGFKGDINESSKKEYFLTNENYNSTSYIYGQNTGISEERINELTRSINYLSRSLWQIQSEVEMKLGDYDYAEELFDLVKEIRNHTSRLAETWRESKAYTE